MSLNEQTPSNASFDLGRTLITPAARDWLLRLNTDPSDLIARHASGDWGDLSDGDKQVNQESLRDGGNLLSAYVIVEVKFYVITDADRLHTTLLLPEEY